MDVQKIAQALEDVSISKKDEEVHHEVLLPASKPRDLLEIDAKTFELLALLDQYETLAEDTRLNYINGHLNLSRANYNGKGYGRESWDLRPYRAAKSVALKEELVLENHEYTKKGKATLEQKQEVDEKKTLNGVSEKQLKNRKKKNDDKPSTFEITEPEWEVKDPIAQFGGMVPYQLRLSQKLFDEGLSNSVKLYNLRAKINSLVSLIERENKATPETTATKPQK
ncbi:uncharacterized protein CANTADRAFT_5069 [Suhomyces tanzawaensis NRRL Y-17324]|uniref:Vacuolar ATPase assembly protein VMA22 n=1 Tax=Suhomyces tanzawaensis NRRL Y-17324 TaxID=984487 RepID=A0A1E4SNJ8_9ASCO|nr:uncharacterized protein CANTADRAFT_5069 [Suhomyces tanzawaensis NRRL Y-17324]ODV81099.1 hypothetical protein CANTADRAFT_5069 [Suhomyces tanzawaensis NRRL Y-17324]